MSAARRKMRSPQMLSVSKQSSAPYPQTKQGAYVFTRYREQRRRRIITGVVVAILLVGAGVATYYFVWPH